MSNSSLIIGLIVLIVIFLLVNVFMVKRQERRHLRGFWKIDPSFAANAQLKDFVIYINDDCDAGYILASNPANIILNCVIGVDITPHSTKLIELDDMMTYDITITYKDLEEKDQKFHEDIFPPSQKIALYPMASRIIFHSDGVVNGIFNKDPTSIKKELLPKELLSGAKDDAETI